MIIFTQIHSEIRQLASLHTDVASIMSLGKSYERREQLAIKVCFIVASSTLSKPYFHF